VSAWCVKQRDVQGQKGDSCQRIYLGSPVLLQYRLFLQRQGKQLPRLTALFMSPASISSPASRPVCMG
jgi:hypothetical protein